MYEIKIGLVLKRLLKSQRRTIKEVSLETGIPYSTLHTWLDNRQPKDIIKAQRLADFLGITLNQLLFDQPDIREEELSGPAQKTPNDFFKGIFEIIVRRVEYLLKVGMKGRLHGSHQSIRPTLFKLRLRQLYRRLDSTALSWELDRQTRSEFFVKARSEFIHILRLKKQIPDTEVASFLSVTQDHLSDIEEGRTKITDREFFLLCTFLGGANDVSKFLEKLECAMRPGLREARKSSHEMLKTYGIYFADDDLGK